MAPFPVYDTDDVKYLENKINLMSMDGKTNYDALPVAACKYCKSLHIRTDDLGNEVCCKCGAENEVVVYKNIDEYLNEINKLEEDI